MRLRFTAASREAQTHVNLSAVRLDGRALWVAGDETATLERLVVSEDGSGYGEQVTYHLADLVDLPGPASEEADVEGLARSGPFLWAVGSHSLKRKRVKAEHDGAKAFRRLAGVVDEVNRHVLLRLPVQDDEHGLPAPVRATGSGAQRLTAAVLGGPGDRTLRDVLADDEHLGPFVAIPSKDNGLDVEGIAVAGERVYLGLRGPVLRGWAFVVELAPYVDPGAPGRLRLRDLEDGRPYRKHLLDLGGLGVRDLCPHGEDLLVLAGPTMDLDGPVRVHRWHGACTVEAPAVLRGDDLTPELDLPYGPGVDHAEGIDVLEGPGGTDDGGGERLLVVYDSPAPQRLGDDGAVVADVLPLRR
ncbi:Protein of unknown function [Quadrisphaera sp. DSM 44207]|nr:Protein of unknown function [Quadrisphaera sp. DSM 44207]